MAKKRHARMDGIGPREIEDIRKALRRVWQYCHARALVIKRCTGEGGFTHCELCKKRTPKLKIDHIEKVGNVDSGFLQRLFTPSVGLQGLCPKCHNEKTKAERAQDRAQKKRAAAEADFF